MKSKKQIRLLFIFGSILFFICVVSAFQGGFSENVINTFRGNDPLLQALIAKDNSEEKIIFSDKPLTDDKSIYTLDHAGDVSVFLLEVFPKKNKDLTDFEKPEKANDLRLPAILKEGTSFGTPLFGGFGYTSVSKNSTVEIKGDLKANRKFHNFKIRLRDDASRYNGQSILNLKKAYGKPCKIEEKFAFDLFAGLDEMMSLRTQFVHLYIKNAASPDPEYESYGLYVLVEQPDDNYFLNRSMDCKANLYKARNFNFTKTPELVDIGDPDYKKKNFESILDIKQGESHNALLDMVNAVNDMSQDIDDVVETYLNRDNILTYLAMNVILGNEDMTEKGYLLYKPVTSPCWYILPENMGETMQAAIDKNHYQVMRTGLSQFSGNLLYERFLQKKENISALKERIALLMDRIGPDTVKNLTNQYIPVLSKYITINPDRGILKTTPEAIIAAVQDYYGVMQRNTDVFFKNINRPEPVRLRTATYDSRDIILRWHGQSSLLGEPVKYTVEVSSDPDFKQLLFTKSDITDTKCPLSKDIFPSNLEKAYFRVKVASALGETAGSANVLKLEDDSLVYGAAVFTVFLG